MQQYPCHQAARVGTSHDLHIRYGEGPSGAGRIRTSGPGRPRGEPAGPAPVRIEGSRRRHADSDLDVAVIIEAAADGVEDSVIDIAFDIDLAFDVYLSPRVIPTAVLHDPVWKLTGFVQAVEREGVGPVKAEAVTLARHRLQRARETLHEGDAAPRSTAQDGAVNRYYYAAFYAARALLATLNSTPPNTAAS